MRTGRVVLLLASMWLTGPAVPAFASHFRGGSVTWAPAASGLPGAVEFRIVQAWRASAFTCPVVGQTLPGVLTFDFGDGTPAALYGLRVTAVDPCQPPATNGDWFVGETTEHYEEHLPDVRRAAGD